MAEDLKEKSDYDKEMDSFVHDIEADVAEYMASYSRDPECIIISNRGADELLAHLIEPDLLKTINWHNPQGVALEIATVELRIFRTVDLQGRRFFIR